MPGTRPGMTEAAASVVDSEASYKSDDRRQDAVAASTVNLISASIAVSGGGDIVNFVSGANDVANLSAATVWDNVYGSNNTTYLSDATANVIGGGDTVEFFFGGGDTASLWNTGGAADTLLNNTGVNGTLFVNNAQANLTGGGDTIDFTSAGANSVTVSGSNETFVAQPVSGADSITGYNATDQVYLGAAQFGTSWATFLASDVSTSGSNTLITDPAHQANQITLVGVASSSLVQGNFHFG